MVVVLDLVDAVSRTPAGGVARVPLASPEDVEVAAAWCERTGNSLIEASADFVDIYRGRLDLSLDDLPVSKQPGYRLWIYTNFHCNLACDYCCVRSSPRANPRVLGTETIERLATEARAGGVRQLFLTGGEPFLLPDIEAVARICATAVPTTILTNGMLFGGPRLERLQAMPRENLVLQISLDGAREVHDAHRGAGSFDRALEGIELAKTEGFRVRVAATLGAHDVAAETALHAILDQIGVARSERLVRRLARRGLSDSGVVVRRESLIPEVTVTATGVYWHPVGADDEDMLVTRRMFPLAEAIDSIRTMYIGYRKRGDILASTFPCA